VSPQVDARVEGGQTASVHATALVLGEVGVLIRGPSGSGKSSLALALLGAIDRRRLFARLVADDRVIIRAQGARLLATASANTYGYIERRGYGIIRQAAEPCAIIRLVVDLLTGGKRNERLPEKEALSVSLCGISLPRFFLAADGAPFERAHAVLGYLESPTRTI
jgi:serine kinase of HPr protein (carbohydrate metabolism regulator)